MGEGASGEELRSRFLSQISDGAREAIVRIVAATDEAVYVAGGVVRDVVLGRAIVDVDVVTEEDAIEVVGRAMAGVRVAAHQRFRTARFSAGGMRIDVATARSETYARPGALPSVVTPAAIEDDLRRRDFSINAMALRLSGEAAVIDPCQGARDIDRRLVRVLHERSFVDDPTRIYRALRYTARFGFEIERHTESRLRAAQPHVAALSGGRLRREIELMLLDMPPGLALEQAEEIGALAVVHPAVTWNDSRSDGLMRAGEFAIAVLPFGFAMMSAGVGAEDAETIVERLRLRRGEAEAVRGIAAMSQAAAMLRRPQAKPSGVVMLLDRYPAASVAAFAFTAPDEIAAGVALRYLGDWRHVKPLLRGDDLIALGVPEGPQVQKGLQLIRASRLDGWSGDEGDERALALRFVKSIRDSTSAGTSGAEIELHANGH
jgi:tRNA nucleotidyltransferase (CCA-adding enzyme)